MNIIAKHTIFISNHQWPLHDGSTLKTKYKFRPYLYEVTKVPDGVASWHVAVSKYMDSPLLSASLLVWDSSNKIIVAVVGVTTALYSVGQLMKELVEVQLVKESTRCASNGYSSQYMISGKGCKLYDVEGREYLDMGSGIAVNGLGHGDPDWIQAVVQQANILTHVSNIYYSLPQVELAKKLVSSSFADCVFFTNSGTEANEAAIKFARKFQRHYNPDANEPAYEFISFTNSFHGRTMGALALTSKEQYRNPFQPKLVPRRRARF